MIVVQIQKQLETTTSKKKYSDINVLHYTGSTTETVNETTYNSLVTSIRNYISTNNLSSKLIILFLQKEHH